MAWLFSKKLMDSASLPCSQELGAEYSAENSSDGEQCALWNGTPTHQASWLPGKMTDACRLSRSGMTFKPLTDDLGEAVLMSFLEDFHVRTSPVQEKEPALTESDQVCGDTWRELSAKFDPATSSWKTHRCLWDEDLPESSVTLPKWGMMQNGVLWERTTLPPLTSATGSGLWPTPRTQMSRPVQIGEDVEKGHKSNLEEVVAIRTNWATPTANAQNAATMPAALREAQRLHPKGQWSLVSQVAADLYHGDKMWSTPSARDWKDTPGMSKTGENPDGSQRSRLDQLARQVYDTNPDGGKLNPDWVEWLMGWPITWTDLKPLGTGRFQQWLNSHGKY